MTTLYRGATVVRSAIVQYLETVVPSKVDQARADWGVDEYELPYPVKYDAYEPYALDQWPLLGVAVSQADNFNRLHYDPAMSNQYMAQYTIRVFTWVRTPMDENEVPIEPEYSESIRLRDDLAACVRAAILQSGCFDQPDSILFDESSLTEEYSEATGIRGDRFVAGVVHSFQLRIDESIPLVGLGDADSISIETQSLGPIP